MNAKLSEIRIAPAWFMLAAVTVASLPVAIALPFDFIAKRNLNLTAFEPLILMCTLWLLGAILFDRENRANLSGILLSLLKAVWPGALLVAVAAISISQIGSFKGEPGKLVLKTLVQHIEYLVVAPCIFAVALSRKEWRDKIMWAFTFGCIVSIIAVVRTPLDKVFSGEIHPHMVGGLLDNRNTFGIFMAVAVCIITGWAVPKIARGESSIVNGPPWLLLPGLILPFLVVYPMLAAGPLVALFLGLGVVYSKSLRSAPVIILALAAWLCWLGNPEEREARGKELARSIQVYRPYIDPQTGDERSAHTMRYFRWAANINMIRKNPLLGVGLGQYQKQINNYYGGIPRPKGITGVAENWDVTSNEPFSFSWFFQTFCETGFVGFAALVVFLSQMVARAMGRAGQGICFASGGVAGAVVALVFAALW
ncbi:MAG: O-antigen ligase family protein, partial [Planctomycetes bacterium]|nr:O-antigen ligase family protein [Planctomycetota bacterium]